MSGISHAQYVEMLSRLNPARVQRGASAVEIEKDLHDEIEQWCRAHGWVCIHSRTDKHATNAIGTPDFILGADDGRVFWIECKRRGGKCSPAQNAMLAWLLKNKQKAFVVQSMSEFLEAIK